MSPAKSNPPSSLPVTITEEDIDAVLEEFGGDPRAAIRALLHDIDELARDFRSTVSKGFVRSELPSLRLAGRDS